ncbi:MAG: 30S ribosomal protein S1 [Acidobacteriota bacterium]
MAIDEVNPSGASMAADSANDNAANSSQSAGTDGKSEEAAPVATAPTPENSNDSSNANDNPENPNAEPETESMGDFSALLENYEKESAASKQEGEIIRGVVVGITEQYVLIDIGYKSEGVVAREEFLDRSGNVTVGRGDEVDVLLKSLENQDGYAVLSRADAVKILSWDKLRQAHQSQETVTGHITKRIKGGLAVDLYGVEAFLPGSQVDTRPVRNLEAYINQDIDVRVIKLNKKRGNVVVSRKAILEEESAKKKTETLANLDEGYIVDGIVKSITDYGAFIDLGGIDGLLHIIDMSWGRIQSPNEMFKVGDAIQVKILKFDREKERISLGYKQLQPDPWQSVAERFPISSKVKGKVVSLTDYGAFIEIEPGVEGLVHVSEMTWSKRLKHPSKLLSMGQEVEAVVLEVDSHNRRISLGIKQALPDPWSTLMERYHVGQRVSGKVRSLTEFGAFIEIEEGIDGLVHVSDISWTKRIKHPSDVLKKGQPVDAIITNIEMENRRLSLSIKDLEPNAWDKFFDTHKVGDVISGKIVRFANFGAFVEIEEGIEGLCHISELSDERVEKPEEVFKAGQAMPFKILKLDREQKKIGLSARAVGKENDPGDIRSYQDTGMATLGDLFNQVTKNEE